MRRFYPTLKSFPSFIQSVFFYKIIYSQGGSALSAVRIWSCHHNALSRIITIDFLINVYTYIQSLCNVFFVLRNGRMKKIDPLLKGSIFIAVEYTLFRSCCYIFFISPFSPSHFTMTGVYLRTLIIQPPILFCFRINGSPLFCYTLWLENSRPFIRKLVLSDLYFVVVGPILWDLWRFRSRRKICREDSYKNTKNDSDTWSCWPFVVIPMSLIDCKTLAERYDTW